MYNKKWHYLLEDILQKCDKRLFTQKESPFLTRLGAQFSTLMDAFHHLYGQHPQFEPSVNKLVNILTQYHLARSEDLKALDTQREQQPHWYLSEKMLGMMLYIDRFADDLEGLCEKISYFEDLGINLIHLMPLVKSRPQENDGGYAVEDYLSVRKDFGGNKGLKRFISLCRKKNISVAVDMVLNHTADTHKWAQKARAGQKKYQDYYYIFESRDIPDEYEQGMPEVFPENAPGNFTYSQAMERWVMTVFHEYQWDLNYKNPEVFLEVLTILLEYSNWGIDVIRLDAVAFLWKVIGRASQNEDEAHIILQCLKAAVQTVAPASLFIAEAIVAPNEIVRYFGEGSMASRECDIAYNASFMVSLWDALATQNVKLMKAGLHSIPQKPLGTTWLTYARCHDDIGLGFSDNDARTAGYDPFQHRQFMLDYYTGKYPGSLSSGALFMYNPQTEDARISGSFASLCGLETALSNKDPHQIDIAIQRIILVHSLLFSIGGIPLLYYGDELAYTNDYSYRENSVTKSDNRWMHRPKIDWEKAELRKQKGTAEHKIFSNLQKLIKIRKTLPEFGDYNNTNIIDCSNEQLLVFTREYQDERTLVISNVSPDEQNLAADYFQALNLKAARDLLSKEVINLQETTLSVAAYTFLWLKVI